MTMEINWKRIRDKNKKVERLDLEGFSDPHKREEYQKKVKVASAEVKAESVQEKWNQICNVVRETGKQVLGCKKNSKKVNDEQLEILSREKHKLRMDINSTTDMPMRKQKQKELKDVKKAVKKRLKKVEIERINNKMIKIEEMKNDSSRYFA